MKKAFLLLLLGLCTLSNAYAATYDATPSGDGYIFSNSFSGDASFNDYIAFNTEGLIGIVGSVSGTGNTFSFQEFNLLDANKNLVESGTVFNQDSQISFGFLKSIQEGSYYLQVVGTSTGATAGYSGTITLTTMVPEPETLSLLLPGLALITLGRKKMGKSS